MTSFDDLPKRFARRWARFSLRGLILGVTLLAVWLGVQFQRAREQQRLLSAVRQMGGHVTVGPERPVWQRLLFPSLNNGFRKPVREVHFLGPDVGDEDLDELVDVLQGLRGLREVTLVETSVSHEGETTLQRRLPGVHIRRVRPVLYLAQNHGRASDLSYLSDRFDRSDLSARLRYPRSAAASSRCIGARSATISCGGVSATTVDSALP